MCTGCWPGLFRHMKGWSFRVHVLTKNVSWEKHQEAHGEGPQPVEPKVPVPFPGKGRGTDSYGPLTLHLKPLLGPRGHIGSSALGPSWAIYLFLVAGDGTWVLSMLSMCLDDTSHRDKHWEWYQWSRRCGSPASHTC